MSFESFVALRYLKSGKKTRFLSILSFVSILGIFISVLSFLVIHSVMNGFSIHLREALIGFKAHLVVSMTDNFTQEKEVISWLKDQPEVERAIPVIEFDGILQTQDGVTAGAKMRGLLVEDLKEDKKLDIFYFENFSEKELEGGENLPGILLGEELYSRLKFLPQGPEIVSVIYPFGDIGPTGEMEPKSRDFRVIGIFSTGFYDFDTQYVLLSGNEARFLLAKKEGVSHVLVRLFHLDTESIQKKISSQFPQLKHTSWTKDNKRLFNALKLEKIGMFLLLSVVTFIASFNILGLVGLFVLRKSADVAVLYSLGMKRWQIRAIFRRIGLFLGVTGAVLGLLGGGILLYYLVTYPIPLPPAYYIDVLPVRVDPWTFCILLIMAPFFSVLASQWPAYRMSKMDPVAELREG